jgi:hypothetical protein
VLKDNDLVGTGRQCARGRVAREGDLHALPIAVVQIIEVVEVVVEPILKGEPRVAGLLIEIRECDRRRFTGASDRRE